MRLVWRRIVAVRDSRDRGMGMVLVIGTSIAAMMAAMGVVSIGIFSLRSSAQHVSFEQGLAAAEAGIDDQLAAIQAANDQDPPVDYSTPSPCNTTGSVPTFATPADERAWAKSVISSLPASCTKTVSSGQYVAFRPAGKQVVYSMGWAPSRTATRSKHRLIKAEYLFGPFKPSNAILTNGDLNFSGSVYSDYVGDATSANVHSNGNITSNGSGSMTILGQITASGSNAVANNGTCPSGVTGPCSASAPLERVNLQGARQIYNSLATDPISSGDWYDLCPGGTVHTPDTSGTFVHPVPCSGPQVGTAPYRGWTYTAASGSAAPLWTLVRQSGTTTYPGAYYVYHGDAQVGDQGTDSTLWNITVMAESGTPGAVGQDDVPGGYTNSASCNQYGGNINWKLFTIQNYVGSTVFVADGNLTGSANTDAGDGMFYAGNKVDLSTSSGTITGAVVAGNQCAAAGPSNIQGMTIHYDQNAQVPVSSIIDTTLWLEYVG
jgi:hypothetical protein